MSRLIFSPDIEEFANRQDNTPTQASGILWLLEVPLICLFIYIKVSVIWISSPNPTNSPRLRERKLMVPHSSLVPPTALGHGLVHAYCPKHLWLLFIPHPMRGGSWIINISWLHPWWDNSEVSAIWSLRVPSDIEPQLPTAVTSPISIVLLLYPANPH